MTKDEKRFALLDAMIGAETWLRDWGQDITDPDIQAVADQMHEVTTLADHLRVVA